MFGELFHKINQSGQQKKAECIATLDPSYLPVLAAADLLCHEKFQVALRKLEALISLPSDLYNYEQLCVQVVKKFAEFVQALPASKSGFYSETEGLLSLGIERACLATSMCRNYLFPHEVVAAEVSMQKLRWIYVIFTAALFHRIGAIVTKLTVQTYQHPSTQEGVWNPLQGLLQETATHYRYLFIEKNRDDLCNKFTILLAHKLMPKEGFDWISQDIDVLSVWFSLLEEDWQRVGALQWMIPLAESEAIIRNLKASEKMAEQHQDAKTSTTLFNTNYSEKANQKTQESENISGTEVLEWIRNAIENQSVTVNKKNSLVFLTQHGVLVHPGIFQEFIRWNPSFSNWKLAMQKFLDLGIVNAGLDSTQLQQFKIGVESGDLIKKAFQVDNVFLLMNSEKIKSTSVVSANLFGNKNPQNEVLQTAVPEAAPPAVAQTTTMNANNS